MSYEYGRGLGATGVTVYGTLPEAQEYVAEEFALPWPVPALSVLPPISPRKPRTAITIFRPEDVLGVDDVCTGARCWYERHKPLVWAAGIAAGMLGMRWLLRRRQRRMLENPSPRDIKLAETARDGSIPLRRGKFKPLDLEDYEEPGRIGANKYAEACFELRPELRERYEGLKKPVAPKKPKGLKKVRTVVRRVPARGRRRRVRVVTRSRLTPEDKKRHETWFKADKQYREFDLPRYFRRRFELEALKRGREHFTPEDWVGKAKMFDRFLTFVMPCFAPMDYTPRRRRQQGVRYSPQRMDKNRIKFAFMLWLDLGMPNGRTLTARAADTVCKAVRLKRQQRTSLGHVLDAAITEHDADHRTVWQLLSVPNLVQLAPADRKVLIETLRVVPPDQAHRIRWWVERKVTELLFERAHQGIDWSELTSRRFWRSAMIGWQSRGERRTHTAPEFQRLSDYAPRRHGARLSLPWSEMREDLALPEKAFVAAYSPSPGDAYSWLYNRVPKKRGMKMLTPPSIAALQMRELLRTLKSDEVQAMIEEEIDRARREEIDHVESRLREQQRRFSDLGKKLSKTSGRLKVHKAKIKRKKLTPKERGEWLAKLNKLTTEKKRLQDRRRWSNASIKRLKKEMAEPLSDEAIESIKEEAEPDMQRAALGLTIIFGPNWRAWLKKMRRRDINVHDATYWLPIEPAPGLGSYLLERWQANIDDLSAIAKGWNTLSPEEQKLSPQQIRAVLLARVFSQARIPELAKEAAKWGTPEADYYRIEKKWAEARQKKAARQSTIPDLQVRHNSYRLFKLPDDDPRGLFLGEHTYCCQHPGGVGEQCAWHGVYSPDGAFYVVEDSEGKIIAQAWTWRTGNDIVFDSVEGHAVHDERQSTVEDMYVALAHKMTRQVPGSRVLSGTWPGDEFESVRGSELAQLPKDYPEGGYSDASSIQWVLADSVAEAREESRRREQEAFAAADRGELYWR
jgi:hypothetical protein